ncbi:unnamed protein product [Somion occarium]|uniref:Spt20-like SEP domain-containing protein n=1 Tax=Somion occarium TaxID=3059160 RepID=A0ABP1E7H9_9APHY
MVSYNTTRYMNELLDKHAPDPPSFTVRLYPEHWTIGGSRFLYNNQMASLLDDIQAQRIPNDFLELFDSAKVAFYDGCMIVELLDYRPLRVKDPVLETPERTRVVLTPNAETLWSEICLMNQKNGFHWTDQDALEVESKILLATAPPLCLDPDPHLTRIANSIMRVSAPTPPVSLKRKAAVMEEEDELERARRAKIMQYMNPRIKPVVPSYRILDVIQRTKMQRVQAPAQGTAAPATHPIPVAAQPTAPALTARPPSTPAPAPSGPASTPTPPVPAATASPEARRKIKRSESSQSPLLARPSSTLPPNIPPHVQVYHAQVGRNTPPSHTPRPPSSATIASSPIVAEKRPSSAMKHGQVHPTQQAQHPHTQPHASPVPQPRQQQSNAALHAQANVTAVNATNFLVQQAKVKTAAPATPGVPAHQTPMVYNYYAAQQHLLAQQRLAAQAQAQGSSTPVPQMMPNTVATPQQRSSPMVTAQNLVSRSPMPNAQQQQPHTGHPQQQPYNNFNVQAYAAQMRQHPHFVQHQLVNNGTQSHAAGGQQGQHPPTTHDQAQQQAAIMAQFPMYGYPMNMQQRQNPQMYWPVGMGRGMPVANAQHQMAGMAGHPQQMPLGAGRAIPGGMQGS